MLPTAAQADAPAQPVTEFNAGLCPGATDDDPRNVQGEAAVPDLTRVFGARLDDYNNGQVVALYDTFGANELNGYPAVCGVRYVEGVGAVSEWMFCTDYFSHVCSGVNENGELVDIDGNPIPGMEATPANPKLTVEQEKLISWLILNGHSYDGTGYFAFNDTSNATQDSGSLERTALQVLVWCISDPVSSGATGTEAERAQTCADNMDADEQARLLAQIPDEAMITLQFDSPSAPLAVGDTAEFELTTNLYDQPIALNASGVDGSLEVVSGNATYDPTAGTLTVAGTDPSATTPVRLSFTRGSPGTVTLSAEAQPASHTHIAWNQSPGVAEDGKPCQVFATFPTTVDRSVSAAAEATFVEAAAEASTNADASGTDAGSTSNADTGASADADAGGSNTGSDAGASTNANSTTGGVGSSSTADTHTAGSSANTGAKNLATTGSTWSPVLPIGAALLLVGAAVALMGRQKNVNS